MLRLATVNDAPTVWGAAHPNLDAAVAAAVEAAVTALLVGGDTILDLAAVRFADSSGLGVLTRLNARFPGRVRMMNVGPALARCLKRAPGDRLPPEVDPLPGWEPYAARDSLVVPPAPAPDHRAAS